MNHPPDLPMQPSKVSRLTQALRWFGTIALLSSVGIFLYQGLGHLNSMEKYLSFLGISSLLGISGVFCATRWKEDKGARTFLGLACATVSAHFSQLGAFFYFLTHGAPNELPSLFVFTAPSTGSVVGVSLLASVILIPLAFVGFSALFRRLALPLTIAYSTMSALLLFPIRTEPLGLAIMILMASFGTFLYFEKSKVIHEPHRLSFDGKLVHGILLSPFAILSLRACFYSGHVLLQSMIGLLWSLYFIVILPGYSTTAKTSMISKRFGYGLSILSWFTLVSGLGEQFSWIHSHQLVLGHLPLALSLFGLSFYNSEDGKSLRNIASLYGVAIAILQLHRFESVAASFLCIIVSGIFVTSACMVKEKSPFRWGMIGLVVGFGYQLKLAMEFYTLSAWMSLGIAGFVVILTSSYLERHWHRDRKRIQVVFQRFQQWN